jgi:hypothetical protein
MQKQNPIDDLFRRELKDYKVKPSPERRNAFFRDAEKVIAKRTNFRWWIVGVGSGLLISAGVGILISQEGRVDKHAGLYSENSKMKAFEKINTVKNDKTNTVVKIINSNKEAVGQSVVPINIAGKSIMKPQLNNESVQSVASVNAISVVSQSDHPKVAPNVQKVPTSVVRDTTIMPPADHRQNIEPVALNEEKMPVLDEKTKVTKMWMFEAGVSYTPEWMFNTFNSDKFVNNMAAEGTVHYGMFSVRTGVGLSITEGSYELNVQTNPYLGTYDKLDSIVFRWNEKHDKLVSTIYTSVNNVYDTSTRNNYSYNKKRYTYLQVPLILGYDFWQNKWLSFGVRVGGVMSVLLKTENISSEYESGQDRIIAINNVTPGRVHMSWQETGGIDASFRLSPRFSIEIEPDVKYYFNSIYESSPAIKKPWSTSLRTAFLITL